MRTQYKVLEEKYIQYIQIQEDSSLPKDRRKLMQDITSFHADKLKDGPPLDDNFFDWFYQVYGDYYKNRGHLIFPKHIQNLEELYNKLIFDKEFSLYFSSLYTKKPDLELRKQISGEIYDRYKTAAALRNATNTANVELDI